MSDDGVRLFLIKICKYEIIAFLTIVWYNIFNGGKKTFLFLPPFFYLHQFPFPLIFQIFCFWPLCGKKRNVLLQQRKGEKR